MTLKQATQRPRPAAAPQPDDPREYPKNYPKDYPKVYPKKLRQIILDTIGNAQDCWA